MTDGFKTDEKALRQLLRYAVGDPMGAKHFKQPWKVVEMDIDDPHLPKRNSSSFKWIKDEIDQLVAIRKWYTDKHGGDFAAALRQSPLIVFEKRTLTGLGVHYLIDGWHRLLTARRLGLKTVTVALIDNRESP